MLPNKKKIVMVIPTFNEALVIERNLCLTLSAFEHSLCDYDWCVIVADNGSTDDTADIVERLSITNHRLEIKKIQMKGKGLAVRETWSQKDADVYAFMDADLSTDIADVPRLLCALYEADIAVGSRFHARSCVTRSLRRECVSRVYRTLVRFFIPLPVQDLQCGFKAIRREAFFKIQKQLTHNGWFFDTELLAFASRANLCISEIPIRWIETPDIKRKSSMNILKSARQTIFYLYDLRRRLVNT